MHGYRPLKSTLRLIWPFRLLHWHCGYFAVYGARRSRYSCHFNGTVQDDNGRYHLVGKVVQPDGGTLALDIRAQPDVEYEVQELKAQQFDLSLVDIAMDGRITVDLSGHVHVGNPEAVSGTAR